MGNMPNRLLGGRGFVAAGLLAALACGDGGTAPAFELADRDRHARFTANGQTVVYYRNNEGPGPIVGIYRVAVTDGTPVRVVQALLAGLDLHPQTDSIVFSARASGRASRDSGSSGSTAVACGHSAAAAAVRAGAGPRSPRTARGSPGRSGTRTSWGATRHATSGSASGRTAPS
jgi:hypothetical protein